MTKSQLQSIAEYIKDLEEDLCNFDLDHISIQARLHVLNQAIKTLMDAALVSKDFKEKIVLSRLEYKAKQCYEAIKERIVGSPLADGFLTEV